MEARNFKTAGLVYWSPYEIDIQCDSKEFTALFGHMSRTVEGVHGKADTFQIGKTFLLNR